MAKWKEGDRVRIVTRDVTAEDRTDNRYYAHMAGLVGTIQNCYDNGLNAVKIDHDVLTKASRDVHTEAGKRLRQKFIDNVGEAARSQLTAEERNFQPNYMLLVESNDLEPAK